MLEYLHTEVSMKKARNLRLAGVGIVLVAICLVYVVWSNTGRGLPAAEPRLFLNYTAQFGSDAGVGNLLYVQPYMLTSDYAGGESFKSKIGGYLEAAKQKGWINPKTIVVLPEYVGTWLVVAGEKRGVYSAGTTMDAMRLVVLSNVGGMIPAYARAVGSDRMRAAIFEMKSASMARLYNDALSSLARQYGVTIVGGSIVLADPSIKNGALVSGSGPLYNVCPVYAPSGRALPSLVKKAFPTSDETSFIQPEPISDLPVFDTAFGKLAVIICADSWYPDTYRVAKHKGAAVVVTVSFGCSQKDWDSPWQGYSGHAAPDDVDKSDVGKLTERQALLKYSSPGRLRANGIEDGGQFFLEGKLWDLECGGAGVIVRKGDTKELPYKGGASLVNVWMLGPALTDGGR